MSRNGSGTYTLPAGNPVVTGTTISSTWANSTFSDLASALTDSVAADGQTTMAGQLDLGNNKIINLANGTNSADAVTFNQLNSAISAAVTGVTGRILQIVQSIYTSSTTTNSTSFVTTNHSVSITPSSASSKILLLNTFKLFQTDEFQPSQSALSTIYRSSTNLAGGTAGFTFVSSGYANSIYTSGAINHLDSPNTTSSTTYTAFIRGAGSQPTAVYESPAMLIALEIL